MSFLNKYPLYGVYSGGDHLFPFRTEKLSPPAQMVLGLKPGRVCRCQFYNKTPSINLGGVFCFICFDFEFILLVHLVWR